MKPLDSATFLAGRQRPFLFAVTLVVASVSGYRATVEAATINAFSTFGPGNTYGDFGETIGGTFTRGYQFTSAANGRVVEIDVGMVGNGVFDVAFYADDGGWVGKPLWNASMISAGSSSPNPVRIFVEEQFAPSLELGEQYWLIAYAPAPTMYWSENTIGALGPRFHQDMGVASYVPNSTLGAFAFLVVPEPGVIGALVTAIAILNSIVGRRLYR
jgi:hypothetical protein